MIISRENEFVLVRYMGSAKIEITLDQEEVNGVCRAFSKDPAIAEMERRSPGRPRVRTLPLRFWKDLPRYEEGEITLTEFARRVNVSRPTIYKYLRIARGEEGNACQVSE